MAGSGQRYSDAIAKTIALRQRLDGAVLRHEWACDASLYFSGAYAGPQFLLVGDAGSFIDPLSSFGVKKALASAWLAAVGIGFKIDRRKSQCRLSRAAETRND